MIYHLKGKIESILPGLAVIDVGGVGYGVFVPERLIDSAIKAGDDISIHTVTVVSQDDLRLFGFLSTVDREFFKMLLGIPRIGPKGAMKIISSASAVTLMRAILAGDLKGLSKIPGVGPKVAQRLVVELQGKVKSLLEGQGEGIEDIFEDAAEVLEGLGCAPHEARAVLARVKEEKKGKDLEFDALLSEALKIMADKESLC